MQDMQDPYGALNFKRNNGPVIVRNGGVPCICNTSESKIRRLKIDEENRCLMKFIDAARPVPLPSQVQISNTRIQDVINVGFVYRIQKELGVGLDVQ